MTAVEGWKTESLGRVAQITMGQSPDSKYYSEEKNGLPFLQGCAEFTSRFPKHALYCSQTKKVANTGSILFSVRAPVGKINIADRDYIVGRGLAAISGIDVDQTYLEYYLKHVESRFRNASQGSTFEAINSSELNKWPIEYPTSQSEQAKIAEILSMADRAIEQTEALIAKQQRIKTGLMQDLLTCGIDEHGNLRTEQTHKFKDSPLGRIPVEWEVVKLSHYITFIRSGLSRRLLENDIGIPVITSTNIQQSLLDTKNLSYWYLKDPQGAKTATYFLDDGDILLNFINSIDQIGKVCIFEDIGRPTIYTTNLFRIKASKVSSQAFLFHLLDSHIVQNEIKFITKPAVNQASFTTGDFLGIIVPLIPPNEQLLIVEFLSALNNNQKGAILSLAKLNHEKTALMQDLLTGKKRVTGLLNDTEVSIL